ncbi:5'/3'-nucleotidase SurE [Tsuneonella suprasediminis]|uniref:5'/3'-nucleotidase SurE n=1 Tax=Tsuneonella suprasediminis TaxID=2306996 RepID=UPI001F0BCA0B|nr:5'/3'-nucleotidase SurE [Tsuneonella suprasediminis]
MLKSLSLFTTALMLSSAPVQARNIVLTNDDGLTSNVVALYRALKKAGHDVVVSVPCTNQSGMGAALNIGHPLTPLKEPCLNNAAQPGDPGAGPMTRNGLTAGDFHYVNGTPVMALLYGLDVLSIERWGDEPDLVLSGPNEGQNVGAIILSSGTVSNSQYAAVRGIPAIALSAGANSEGPDLANPISAQVAQRVVELVNALEHKAGEGALLPRGLALNVNFPDELDGAQWRATQVGTYNTYAIGFTVNMAETASPAMRAIAEGRGMQVPPPAGPELRNKRDPSDPGPGER